MLYSYLLYQAAYTDILLWVQHVLLVLMFYNFYVINLHLVNVSLLYLQLSDVQNPITMALCS